jgi:hypothetical protein
MAAAEISSHLLLIVFVGVSACGGNTKQDGRATGAGGRAQSVAEGGTSGHAGSAGAEENTAGAAGTVNTAEPLCSTPTTIDPPSLADDCVVLPRTIDPESTCGAADCPIIRAFDLSCGDRIDDPRLSCLDDRTLLLVASGSQNRLLTVTDTETEVSHIDVLHHTPYRLSSAFATTWYVAREWSEIIAVSGNGETWFKSTVVSDPSDGWARVSDAALVDETQGYVAYRVETMGIPHLVTWDGSCWTDEILTDTATDHLLLGVDADGLPWTAWVTHDTDGDSQIVLRDPTGVTQPVYAATQGWRAGSARSVSLLPGAFDGHDTYPTLAVCVDDGINVDCPYTSSIDPDPCGGVASCTTQVEGNGEYYGLARTASQGTFAVWVSYSSLGDSVLSVSITDDELPQFLCRPTETTGSGTAELVLARVADTEPVLTRYRFDLGAGLLDLWQPVAVAARGDTLIVAAVVSGGDTPALTYFEIDSTLLP